MVFYLIGLGLGDHKDITVRGLECVKSCSHIFLEYYTSVLGVDKAVLEEFYGKSIEVADRDFVETRAEEIYMQAKTSNVALLVVGDPLCATTHLDIILRAKKENIKVEVIHNSSVMGAAASCGLQLYQFGFTVSIPWFEEGWTPSSFYERIQYNLKGGMHTLCLLDIKVKEPDYESMIKFGKVRYLPPRFMTVNTAIEQLLQVEEEKKEGVLSRSTLAVGMARLGQPTQKIVAGTFEELLTVDFGAPLHCMAICGQVHPLEQEFLEFFSVANAEREAEAAIEEEGILAGLEWDAKGATGKSGNGKAGGVSKRSEV